MYQGNRRLTLYVAAVALCAAGLLLTNEAWDQLISWAFLLWFLFSVGAELLWLETPTGEATDSMASTFNVAVLYLFGNGLSLWIIGLSVLVATRWLQRRDSVKSIFGLSQMVVTAYAAGSVFQFFAGGPGNLDHFHTARGLTALGAACFVYFAVNTTLVAGAVSIEKGLRFWPTLRENYLYRNALTSSGTLFALSPILLLSYLSIGYAGVFLFFLPLLIVKEQNRAYIELQRATQALIRSERMAAKGEMAAAVAHEMNNYLSVLSGRTQLLQRKAERQNLVDFVKDSNILWTQVERLIRLAKGLVQFSGKEIRIGSFDLNALCQETVEFLQPQNLFDGVRLELEVDSGLGAVEGDQGQIHQILLNLCRNAAQALRDAGTVGGEIVLRTGLEGSGYVRFDVSDSGPGIPEEKKARIFEPGFTTKADGHGFGLAICFRIMENHRGRIWVEDRPGGGTRFRVAWPRRAPQARAEAA